MSIAFYQSKTENYHKMKTNYYIYKKKYHTSAKSIEIKIFSQIHSDVRACVRACVSVCAALYVYKLSDFMRDRAASIYSTK